MVELTTELINRLLNPLGMKLHTYKCKMPNGESDESTTIVYDNDDNDDNGYGVDCVHNNGFLYSTVTYKIGQDALKHILGRIMQAKYWIKKDGKHLDNPYYNCRSLEEMLIKRDLIV